MSRPVSTFLNDVVQFLEEEILPDAHTDARYFDNCVTRVDIDNERVSIRDLSYCLKNQDGQIVRVNDVLSRTTIRLEFQMRNNPVPGSWSDGLSQCTIGLHVPEIDTPTVLKWELRGDTTGALKADERFDHDREYIEQNIAAKTAVETAIWEHFETIIPSLRDQSSTDLIPPVLVQTLYNEDHQILQRLNQTELG